MLAETAKITEIRQWASQIAARRKRFMESLSHAECDREVRYDREGKRIAIRLREIFLQVCNHGMHHRAQAFNLFKKLSVDPPRTPFLLLQVESPLDPPAPLSAALLRDYIHYTDWARELVMTEARKLSDEQLDRPFDFSMGSIRCTLAHLSDTDAWWLDNWSGGGGWTFPQSPEPVGIDELDRRLRDVSARRRALLEPLSDQALSRPVHASLEGAQPATFSLGQTIIEICNHATHHRAHVINMMRQVGVTVPLTDYAVTKLKHLE
jgi:uncharacterized damage-inducible protein DinB